MEREKCLVCQIADNSIPSKKLYEDNRIMAVLDVNGSNPGHCFVFPKSHYPIIEQVPDDELGMLFQAANKISGAIFEALKAEGTNLFVANGVPAGQTVAHFMINIIPRFQNDGINLQWQPKQMDEEEMSTVELRLKEQAEKVGVGSGEVKTSGTRPKKEIPFYDYDEDSEAVRQIIRIP